MHEGQNHSVRGISRRGGLRHSRWYVASQPSHRMVPGNDIASPAAGSPEGAAAPPAKATTPSPAITDKAGSVDSLHAEQGRTSLASRSSNLDGAGCTRKIHSRNSRSNTAHKRFAASQG